MTGQPPSSDHESFGTITFTHRHGPERHAFGSPVQHSDLIHIDIHQASLVRSNSKDQFFSNHPIFSGYMSHAQIDEALFALGNGPATPITIEFVAGDTKHRQPPPPPEDPAAQFDQEIDDVLKRILNDCDQLAETTKGRVRSQALSIKHSLQNNIPFIKDRLKETVHSIADHAKREFDAYRDRTIQHAGVNTLNALSAPNHSLPATPFQHSALDQAHTRQARMEAIIQVHGDQIRRHYTEQVPQDLIPNFQQVTLTNNTDFITIQWQFDNGANLKGPSLDTEELARLYPESATT